MATAVYWPRESTKSPGKCTQKGRIRKGKRKKNRRDRSNYSKHSNQTRENSRDKGWRKINGTCQYDWSRYIRTVRKEKKTKRSVKLHQYIKKRKQRSQRRETTGHAARIIKESITVNGNVKWCSQDKISNKKKSVVHKKNEYNVVKNKYIQKIEPKQRIQVKRYQSQH